MAFQFPYLWFHMSNFVIPKSKTIVVYKSELSILTLWLVDVFHLNLYLLYKLPNANFKDKALDAQKHWMYAYDYYWNGKVCTAAIYNKLWYCKLTRFEHVTIL